MLLVIFLLTTVGYFKRHYIVNEGVSISMVCFAAGMQRQKRLHIAIWVCGIWSVGIVSVLILTPNVLAGSGFKTRSVCATMLSCVTLWYREFRKGKADFFACRFLLQRTSRVGLSTYENHSGITTFLYQFLCRKGASSSSSSLR